MGRGLEVHQGLSAFLEGRAVTDKNPRFETYFAKPRKWQAEFNALRQILLDCQLTEELKWRQPCYCFEGANIVILSGFKDFCALGFFKGSLMPDPEHVLVAPGPNSRAARMLRFQSIDEVMARDQQIRRYVKAAVHVEQSGEKVDFSANKNVPWPDELQTALKEDAAFRNAFDGLTPGRQRGWILHFESAKQAKTRGERISKARAKIMRGEGMHDGYRTLKT
jgi:uncharacterized protein YdeI (YjbR/CyaY-like superfamily)